MGNHRPLLASTALTLALSLTPTLALSQGPPPPSSAGRYILTTIDVPNAVDELGQVTLTDLNENSPPQLTVALNFFGQLPAGVRQPGLIYTREDQQERFHCNAHTLWTIPNGINRHKDTAGTCYRLDATGQPVTSAFYRSAAGTVTLIPIPGASASEATDVNNHKRVTGLWIDHAGDCHGFLWDAVTRRLSTFDAPFAGASCTVPLVMNNGDVIGGLYHKPVGAVHAFLYDSRRQLWTDVEPDGADVSATTGLNDFGTAVVFAQTIGAGTTISTYEAPTDTFAVLPWPLPPFGPEAVGFSAINNNGRLLGFHEMTVFSSDPDAPAVGFMRGVVATPLPSTPTAAVARTSVAPQRQAQALALTPAVQPAMVLGGCPGDGVVRPGKLQTLFAGCR